MTDPVRRSRVDRISAALPLASVYLTLCVIYMAQAWARATPWLFTDELEMTQLSRSIAATGRAARRGVAHRADSLYVYLTAPLWWIDDVGTAYAAVKYLDCFVMASVIFPTYFLARMLVGRPWALFAGATAAAIPSLAYSSYIVEETLAYPYAALCLFLVAKALVTQRRGWVAAAVIASLLAPFVRGELSVVPGIFALAALLTWWSGERGRSWQRTFSLSDWAGLVAVVLGAIFFVSAVVSHHALEWLTITRAYKDRMVIMGNWAAGALAIGLGVVPLVAGLAALWRARGEDTTRELRVFRCVGVAGIVAFGLYTAMKAAYLSTEFASRVEERNLIYVAPLLLVGTAYVLERRRISLVGLAIGAAYALYLVGYALYHSVGSPYEMGVQLYSDALGFAILQQANRYLHLDTTMARWLLVGVLLLGLLLLLSPRLLPRRRRLVAGLTAGLAAGIFAWTFTGQIAAATGTVSLGHAYGDTLGHPFSWVDDATGVQPTLYMGQGEVDQNPEWLLEFWNRSIARVSSLDGTVQGPGPADGPDLLEDGTLLLGSGGPYEYGVQDTPCVDLEGQVVATHGYRAGGRPQLWELVRLTKPNRIRSMCMGLYPDKWSGASDSVYYRFGTGRPGSLRVVVSRRDWSGDTGPSPVHVVIGTLVVNANRQPAMGKVTKRVDLTIDSRETKTVVVPAPAAKFAAQVVVDEKFVPSEHLPVGDSRVLGAQIDYEFVPAR